MIDWSWSCSHSLAQPGWPCPFCGQREYAPTRADLPPAPPDLDLEGRLL